MRIWHQSFTVLDDVPHYRDALQRHLSAAAAPGTTVELHGMKAGTYPSAYPGTHIGYSYLSSLHREQFVAAALQAQDEGYDAFLIATIPDTGYEVARSLVDIPVVTFGQTSVLMAGMLGDCVGIVNFIAALEPQLRRNLRDYRLDSLVGPITQVDAAFTDVMAAYADPQPLLDAFTTAARRVIADGANVIVPGEGPLNVFLADQGLSRVDDVPVLDSLGTCVRVAELRAAQHRSSGLVPSRAGFHHAQPPRELVDAARAFYGLG
ncbi:aspartate/glutamate racemase family protein [Nocardioides sp. cx-173]|uniref:aspartate/glutamate racemase family protein n=1 Tax=Nocardioides sp. cx-173 TaxID=2898796 RepID=UPI001E571091|nr:aspartate/glutamate racemase family protein [Nocardioides sp. cx-173]MCD4526568.1 aspartate/glutamate racemase family protein [Nocardioides sp. cx-173]UGB40663.1 aspartate/glutamate racemase family protein [Nocardioides sp. cx-173]